MTAKFRIDFRVSEILDEGSTDEARFVTMGDEVTLPNLYDFFQRCGLAIEHVFMGLKRPMVLTLRKDVNWYKVSKINLIKAIRQLEDMPLKLAKDLVEKPQRTPLVHFKDEESAAKAWKIIEQFEVVDAVELNHSDIELKFNDKEESVKF